MINLVDELFGPHGKVEGIKLRRNDVLLVFNQALAEESISVLVKLVEQVSSKADSVELFELRVPAHFNEEIENEDYFIIVESASEKEQIVSLSVDSLHLKVVLFFVLVGRRRGGQVFVLEVFKGLFFEELYFLTVLSEVEL